jgi:hypothetical protein
MLGMQLIVPEFDTLMRGLPPTQLMVIGKFRR